MSETWFFGPGEGRNIELRSTVEGDDGAMGDATSICEPGGSWLGIPYQQLASRGSGKLTVENNVARIDRG
jgi:hypothetical protein